MKIINIIPQVIGSKLNVPAINDIIPAIIAAINAGTAAKISPRNCIIITITITIPCNIPPIKSEREEFNSIPPKHDHT